jgi:hypothetical protein
MSALPLKQTSAGRLGMSEKCQQETHAPQQTASLFDHLAGAGNGVISGRGWKRPFNDPIPLPRGRQLLTLEDAAKYIQKLLFASSTPIKRSHNGAGAN